MARKGKVSDGRKRVLSERLIGLATKYIDRNTSEVSPVEIEDYLNSQPWGDLVWNVSLGDFRMFFRDCVKRGFCATDPTADIRRKRGTSKNRNIGTFSPAMVKRMLSAMPFSSGHGYLHTIQGTDRQDSSPTDFSVWQTSSESRCSWSLSMWNKQAEKVVVETTSQFWHRALGMAGLRWAEGKSLPRWGGGGRFWGH